MGALTSIGALTAFGAGLVSFLSPCVLPLVPAYMSYVAGQPLGGATRHRTRGHAALLSACFVLGFSLVFVALGVGRVHLLRRR